MNRRTYPILLFLIITTISVRAQKANYSGRWVLDMEKSSLQSKPEGLTSSIFIIKQTGNTLRLVRYHIKGAKEHKIGFKMHADGKTRRVKILFKGKLEWEEQHLVASLWRKNFSNIVVYKFGIDSNELIADETFKSPGDNHHNIWVFQKRPE